MQVSEGKDGKEDNCCLWDVLFLGTVPFLLLKKKKKKKPTLSQIVQPLCLKLAVLQKLLPWHWPLCQSWISWYRLDTLFRPLCRAKCGIFFPTFAKLSCTWDWNPIVCFGLAGFSTLILDSVKARREDREQWYVSNSSWQRGPKKCEWPNTKAAILV